MLACLSRPACHGRRAGRSLVTLVSASAGSSFGAASASVAAVDMSAVEFVAVAEDTLAEVVDTPVVAAAVTGRGEIC